MSDPLLTRGGRRAAGAFDRLHVLGGDRKVGQGSRSGLSITGLDPALSDQEQTTRSVHHGEHDGDHRGSLVGAAPTPCGLRPLHLGIGARRRWLAFVFSNISSWVTVIVAHVRLLTELKNRADRLREERYGQVREPGSSGPAAFSTRKRIPGSAQVMVRFEANRPAVDHAAYSLIGRSIAAHDTAR